MILLCEFKNLGLRIFQPRLLFLFDDRLLYRLPVDGELLVDISDLFLQFLFAIGIELVNEHIFYIIDLRHSNLDILLGHFDRVGACKLQLFLRDPGS